MDDPDSRRREFVDYLHTLARDLAIEGRVGTARATVARFRRGLLDVPPSGALVLRPRVPPLEAEFYRFRPPEREIDAWRLVAGLFAINPTSRPGQRIAAVLGTLTGRAAVEARMRRLMRGDAASFEFYLRQAVTLVRPTPLDYRGLLNDVVLLSRNDQPDRAYQVRVRWAREFHTATPRQPNEHENSEEGESE